LKFLIPHAGNIKEAGGIKKIKDFNTPGINFEERR
jgi:hypothetical protein